MTDEELKSADVLVLIYPNEPWREGQLERIRRFVENGGTMCVFGEHTVREKDGGARFNDVLQGTGIRVRFDSAYYAVGGWLHSYDALVHPVTMGIRDERNQFGLVIGASLDVHWPARPLIVGRWGWSDWGDEGGSAMMGNKTYDEGERLGDLVLVAEQKVGKGRVVVFGDTSGISNGINIGTHVFNSRVFAYLCSGNVLSGTNWRGAVTFLAAMTFVALLVTRRNDGEAAFAFVLLPVAFVVGVWNSSRKMDIFPKAREGCEYRLAYLDAAHLNLFSSESWRDDGLMGLALTLMRNGYLTLMLPEFRSDRILEADLVVCVAPARAFTPSERALVRRFLEKGGVFILTVGREEAGPADSLLSDLGFTLGENQPAEVASLRHPPLGHFKSPYLDTGRYRVFVRFHAAWPVMATAEDAKVIAYGPGDRPVIWMRRIGKGKAVVIGDTCFAMNKNLEVESGCPFEGMRENPHFWRWLITQLRDEPMWIPPDPKAAIEEPNAP
ncbi:MAG: GldG family protein [Kiritimatiellae bacterium]|nr:GldG family protein [Kiritimatiellia bacterium]